MAMASPGGCKFDKDRAGEGLYFRGKVPVSYLNGVFGVRLCSGKGCATFPTDSPLALSASRNAVFCSALRTTDNNAVIHENSLAVSKKSRILTPQLLHVTQYKAYFHNFNR